MKDRIALSMVAEAKRRGEVRRNTTLIEATSGNTGIGLACVCAARGLHLVLVMPETMSEERRRILQALGADLLLTPGKKGMSGAVAVAEKMSAQNPNYLLLQQFENQANRRFTG